MIRWILNIRDHNFKTVSIINSNKRIKTRAYKCLNCKEKIALIITDYNLSGSYDITVLQYNSDELWIGKKIDISIGCKESIMRQACE